MANLKRQLYLVVNDNRIVRLHAAFDEQPNAVPNSFTLGSIGSIVQGKLAFEVPVSDASPPSLQLRYYHDEYSPLVVSVRQKRRDGETEQAPAKPADDVQQNKVASLSAYDFQSKKRIGSHTAPKGMRYVTVDLRGAASSHARPMRLALDANAKPSEKTELGKVFEYLKAESLLQVVVDGEYGYVIDPQLSELPAVPAFLPDVVAGGEAVFVVAEKVQSLELVCYFPQYKMAGGENLGVPEPLRFTLEGEPRQPQARQAIAAIRDKPTPIGVMNQQVVRTYGGRQAAAGQAFLVLTLSARNESDEGGMFNVTSRFECETSTGKVKPIAVMLPGGVNLPEPLWLPAKERRTFDLLFAVPADEQAATLHYAGVSVATAVDLNLRGDEAAVVKAQPSPSDDQSDHGQGKANPDGAQDVETPDTATALASKPATPLTPTIKAEAQKAIALHASAQNEAIRLDVSAARFASKYQDDEPADGNTFLVLQTRWSRRDTEGGEYVLESLSDHLVGVVDGRQLREIHTVRGAKNALPRDIRLEEPNAVVQGTLVFEVPKAGIASFELHLIDPKHGHMRLPLLPQQGKPTQDEPVLPVQQNRVAAMGVFGYEVTDSFRGHRAHKEDAWLVIDLRGRSLLSQPRHDTSDASHQEREDADAQLLGMPLHWRRWDEYTQLIVDGIDPHVIRRGDHTMPDPMRLLPDAMTGGKVAFELPRQLLEEAQSVELLCGFAPTAVPGHRVLPPKAMRFVIKGKRPALPKIDDTLLTIDDANLRVDVTAQRTPETVAADYAPRDGSYWLQLDFVVTAKDDEGVFFAPGDYLNIKTHDGVMHDWHRYSRRVEHAPPNSGHAIWIPPNGRRRFTLVWQLPLDCPNPTLFYTGLLEHRGYRLSPIKVDGAAVKNDAEKAKAALPDPSFNPNMADNGVQIYYPELKPKGIKGVGLTAQQVNEAIDRGRDFLWQELQEKSRGAGFGNHHYNIPAMLALVHCDAHQKYPAFDEGLRTFLHRFQPTEARHL